MNPDERARAQLAISALVKERALKASLAAGLEEWWAKCEDPVDLGAFLEAVQAARCDDQALAELQDAFRQLLPIGTGGRRGKVAPGPNRVNSVTLRETVFGLHCTMEELGWPQDLIVGYDTRCDSQEFAHLAANLLVALGRRVHLLDAPRPTPQIAFWLRKLSCGAGVVISASHNPPGDNGIKIYGPDGAQVFAQRDRALSRAIEIQGPKAPWVAKGPARSHERLVRMKIEGADAGYLQEVQSQGVCTSLDLSAAGPVVYTALQGVGYPIIGPLLSGRGVALHPVQEQCEAGDGRFSRTKATNPEDPRAFDRAIEVAQEKGAKIILANDPDADRLGVCLWSERSHRYEVVEGNDVSALLTWLVCSKRPPDPKGLVASTLVTSSLVQKIATEHGFYAVDDLLVGFKHHAAYAEFHPELDLVFGCEESLGYIRGNNIRDKDGAIAALLFCELMAVLAQRGETWEDRLDALWCRYGLHVNHTENLRFEGQAGAAIMDKVMQSWRRSPPAKLGTLDSKRWVDHQHDPQVHARGPVRGAASNLMVGTFEHPDHKVRLVLRPSGTEPKLKLYLLMESAPCTPEQLPGMKAQLRALTDEVVTLAKAQVLERT